MNKEAKKFALFTLRVGVVVGVVIGVVLGICGTHWFWEESPREAYERGKIDGQVLELRLQGNLDEKTMNLLIECIHLGCPRLRSFFDSTDTMPAVEIDWDTTSVGFFEWYFSRPGFRIDTVYGVE